jgi:hypothetical protein
MNNTIYYDSQVSDDDRREQLYGGQLHAFSPRKSILDFVTFARAMIEDAFGGVDPRTAQDQMEVEAYAGLLGKLKPAFIHHPESKRHLQTILADLSCDLEKTYFDVPRMRSSTSSGYLTTGIALPGTPTATRGTRRRPARSIGGCRSTSSTRRTRRPFTRAIGANPSPTARPATTTTPGTSCIAARAWPS